MAILSPPPSETRSIQGGALCNVMRIDCVEMMNSLTTLTVKLKIKDPEKILSALVDHFLPQNRLLFERVTFGLADQAEHETIEQYVVRLRQLAESCEFEGLCGSLIRDKLLRERPVPSLIRCIEALRTSGLSRMHKEQLKDAMRNHSVIIVGLERNQNKTR